MKTILPLLLLLILLAACAAPVAEAAVAKSDKPRETAPQAAESDLAQLADGNQAFAFDLYRALSGQEGNLFFSPFSLSEALAMTYGGARGETERQMAATLHFSLPQAQLHPAFNAVDQSLNKAGGESGAFRLSVANSQWGQKGFPFRAEFLDLLAVNYGAELRLVDYQEETGREAARQAINQWVSDATQGKIKELIGKDILTELTRLVLANAIYFKGEWVQAFGLGTKPAPFTLLDGSRVEVPTMETALSAIPYAESLDYQAIELDYRGGRVSMVIILPAAGQFESFEAGLDDAQVEAILQALEPRDLKLYLPKFAFESRFDLVETLKSMGMPDASDPKLADFSGEYDRSREPRNLYISKVIHGGSVSVDERGTEATAASAVIQAITGAPIGLLTLRIDRPFIFLIRDRESGQVLFVGRVVDPR